VSPNQQSATHAVAPSPDQQSATHTVAPSPDQQSATHTVAPSPDQQSATHTVAPSPSASINSEVTATGNIAPAASGTPDGVIEEARQSIIDVVAEDNEVRDNL
jgi:hypothetical protein